MSGTGMRRPALVLLAAASHTRALILAAVSGVVVALLLIAASILRVHVPTASDTYGYDDGAGAAGVDSAGYATEILLDPLVDPGTRGGVVFAVVLMTVPLLVLLRQTVRMGSSGRDRRYAALGIAGVTRRELARWGALEVVLPTAIGVVLGFGLWQLARYVLGWPRFSPGDAGGLVPTQTGPGWWAIAVVALVLVDAAVVGLRAGGRSADAWQTSKSLPPVPGLWRPLALLAIVVAAPLALLAIAPDVDSQLLTIPTIALLVLALAVSAPWFGWQIARRTADRTSRVSTLLAARRLAADPHPAARAAATAGAASLACSIALIIGVDAVVGGSNNDPALKVSLLVCLIAIVAAIGVIAVAVTIRSAEAVAERRREISALIACGIPADAVTRSLTTEARMVAIPLSVVGAGLGTAFGLLVASGSATLLTVLGGILTVALMAFALSMADRLTRSVVRDALDPENLRTE